MSSYVTEQLARHQISDRVRAAEQWRLLRKARRVEPDEEVWMPVVEQPRPRFVPRVAPSR